MATSTRRYSTVETERVQPVRPTREQVPAGVEGTKQFREAESAYETALLAYAAEVGAPAKVQGDYAAIEAFFNKANGKAPAASVVPVLDAVVAEASGLANGQDGANGSTDRKPRRTRSAANRETVKAAEKKQPAPKVEKPETPAAKRQKAATAKAKTSTAKKASATRAAIPPPSGFKSWQDPKLAAKVLKLKDDGKTKRTIKQVAEVLGVPAEERYWHRVSLVFRAAADAAGVARPKLSAEAIEARKAKASA